MFANLLPKWPQVVWMQSEIRTVMSAELAGRRQDRLLDACRKFDEIALGIHPNLDFKV